MSRGGRAVAVGGRRKDRARRRRAERCGGQQKVAGRRVVRGIVLRTGERSKAASAIVSQLEVAGRYIVRVIVAGAGGGRKAAGTIIIIIRGRGWRAGPRLWQGTATCAGRRGGRRRRRSDRGEHGTDSITHTGKSGRQVSGVAHVGEVLEGDWELDSCAGGALRGREKVMGQEGCGVVAVNSE